MKAVLPAEHKQMEMTSRQKDKVGLHRYGLYGYEIDRLVQIGSASKPATGADGYILVKVVSYIFSSNDNGETYTGPHLGKPDLDSVLKRNRIIPQKIAPLPK